MREYRFSLTHIVPYKDRIVDTGEYGSRKTCILAYLMQRSDSEFEQACQDIH